VAVGSEKTKLIVLRGNSGSGKSTVARALRETCGIPETSTLPQTVARILADARLPESEDVAAG
jgi:adenylate kinase family enzyme